MNRKRNTYRIIAGQWRGRTLTFPDLPLLRPTTDRIRETLFNWLQTEVAGARCLDLFSGSGALGFEAISRGAAAVTSVENSAVACQSQQNNAQVLEMDNLNLVQADVSKWLQQTHPQTPFDIVFMDPPYAQSLLENCCSLLAQPGWLTRSALIYLEDSHPLSALTLPPLWQWQKTKKAGQVYYGLCRSGG